MNDNVNSSSSALPSLSPFRVEFYERHFARLMILMFVGGMALLLLSAATGGSGSIIVGDAIGHFEYARSLAVSGRLPEQRITYPCGVSMIGAVGYFPSMALTRLAWQVGWLNSPAYRAGTGLFNQIAYCLPFILLAALALRLNLATIRRLGFADRYAKPALIFLVAGTNVGYYFFKEPGMSESSTYATLSLFYYLLIRHFYGPSRRVSWVACVSVGLALGWAGIIRQQNILHCVAVALLALPAARAAWPGRPLRAAGEWARTVGTVALASAAVFVIPYFAWAASRSGAALYSYGGQGFDFLHPHLVATLLHPRAHGLFVWTPIFLLAAIGLVFLFRRHPRLAPALLVPILLQYYLISSWWGFSFGASVGQRGFFTTFPVLMLGLPALLEAADRRGMGGRLAVLLVMLTAANLALMLLVSAHVIRVV